MDKNVSTSPTKAQKSANNTKHSSPFYFSNSLFRNKRLKQKRLKWALKISKDVRVIKKNCKKTDYRNTFNRCGLASLPPEITINLLSDDEQDCNTTSKTKSNSSVCSTNKLKQSLPQLVVFPTTHLQISKSPNITLIPVKTLPSALAATVQQNRNIRKRKSQKPKRLSEPTIINKESIVLSDDSNDEMAVTETPAAAVSGSPAACSTPNHMDAHSISNTYNSNYTCPAHATIAPRIAQVDEEVTVSLVPRCSAAGSSCSSSKASNSADVFPMAPDETTVQTIISNRIYELSLTKLREGLATSGVGEFADDNSQNIARRTNFNLPQKQNMQNIQPVALKLSSDLSISLISDDEESDTTQQQQINAEKLMRQQPHLTVRPIGVVTVHRPPKRRKLG